MNYKVSTIPNFDKQVKRLAKKFPSLKKDLANFSATLNTQPRQGTSLGNNFYKVRFPITSKGRGKSGGARIITYVKITTTMVYLTSIYDKSEQASITKKELKKLLNHINTQEG